MKQKITAAGVFFLLLFLLKYPLESLSAAREGMKLWLNTLIPTLLPFLILTGILLHTKGIEKFFMPLSPFWKTCFGLSPGGAYAFLLGMFCGFPMGAKIAADLLKTGKIDSREAAYLITFSNNPSPVFITTYLAQISLGGSTRLGEIFIILSLSNFLCMLFFRFIVYRNKTVSPAYFLKKETSSASSQGTVIDVSIMNSFETIARLGGYILIFSLVAAVIHHCCPTPSPVKYIALGITEITTGLYQLSSSGISYPMRYLCAMTMTAFGGLCTMAQTKSVLEGRLPILPYAFAKCLNAIFTAILVLIFVKFI